MYSDHLHNCLDYGYSLLIFVILMLFWLSEMGQIWGFHGSLVVLCGYSSLWWPFGWNWSYLGFLDIIWRTCGSKCRGGNGGIFPTLCVEFCLIHFVTDLFASANCDGVWWFWTKSHDGLGLIRWAGSNEAVTLVRQLFVDLFSEIDRNCFSSNNNNHHIYVRYRLHVLTCCWLNNLINQMLEIHDNKPPFK